MLGWQQMSAVVTSVPHKHTQVTTALFCCQPNVTHIPHKHTQVTTSLNWRQSPSSNEVRHITCYRPTHHLLKMSLLQLILERLYFILKRSNNWAQHLCIFLSLADVHTRTLIMMTCYMHLQHQMSHDTSTASTLFSTILLISKVWLITWNSDYQLVTLNVNVQNWNICQSFDC